MKNFSGLLFAAPCMSTTAFSTTG